MDWGELERERIRAAARWRSLRDLDARGPAGWLAGGRQVVSFTSNDYLGLTLHPAVARAAAAALERWGSGAGAARLLVGSRPVHSELEGELAEWKGAERALLFPTGYMANLGVLSGLAGPGVLVCSDELNHASIIDGCRLARAEVGVYPHLDLEFLERRLAGAAGRALVVTESVFSMDGDQAPVAELVEICARRGALLVLDEAHAVLGPEPPERPAGPVLRVGTLSKTLASLGGFVAGPRLLIELLVNRARSFIYTTAPAPAVAAAALAALRVVRSAEGEGLRARLRELVRRVAGPGAASPIVPLVVGSEQRALELAAAMLERGLLVPAIRPPTVPPGTARLRVTLSAAHSDDQVARLLRALRELREPAHAG